MDSLLRNNVNLISNTDLLNFYKDIAQQQSANYSNLITVLLAITVVLVGSTWLWNFLMAQRQIKNEIIDQSLKIKEAVTNEIIENNRLRFEKFEIDFEKKMMLHEANLCRLYAASSFQFSHYTISVNWWLQALKIYFLLDDHRFARVCVDSLLSIVVMEEWLNADKEANKSFNFEDSIKILNSSVHESLHNEKKILIEAFQLKFSNSKK